jgi:hypothetical protein
MYLRLMSHANDSYNDLPVEKWAGDFGFSLCTVIFKGPAADATRAPRFEAYCATL